MRFQPEFTATASNIGYSFWSHDIGGHMMGYRDDELNARWVQFGVFSPIFRIHSSNSPFTVREPWSFNIREGSAVRKFMDLRHEIFPYLYTMCHRNYEELIPVIRPMYHSNPEDINAYRVPNEYWFGSELIASPITEKSDRVSMCGRGEVWLPEGKWVDWFTGTVYNGNDKFDVYRTVENMPLFLKSGAIVPTRKPDGANLLRAEELNIVIAAGNSNAFTLYEDDGVTRDYCKGVCCKTKMLLNWSENEAEFTLCPPEGELSLLPERRSYKLTLKGFSRQTQIFINGVRRDVSVNVKNGDITVTVGTFAVENGFTVKIIAPHGLLSDNDDIREKINDIIMRAQCMNGIKHNWDAVIDEAFAAGCIDPTSYVGTPDDRLGPAVYELLRQKITRRIPIPTPGLPKPFKS